MLAGMERNFNGDPAEILARIKAAMRTGARQEQGTGLDGSAGEYSLSEEER